MRPITAEERAWLQPFTSDAPEQVADAVGCAACHDTGYRGREGVFEVLELDADITAAVRAQMPVGELRAMVRQRGTVLAGSHGVEKVRALTCPARDVYEQILIEERTTGGRPARAPRAKARPAENGARLLPASLLASSRLIGSPLTHCPTRCHHLRCR